MKKIFPILVLAALLPAGAATADDDCRVPAQDWQPRAAVMAIAAANGWSVRDIEIDDGCYEIEGRDASGQEIDVTLDPATLEILEVERADEDDDDDRAGARPAAPAGSVAPPANGLFGNGAPPQVQVN